MTLQCCLGLTFRIFVIFNVQLTHTQTNNIMPRASKKEVLREESLAVMFPEVAADWDEDRNETEPHKHRSNERTQVYWRCAKDSTHKWKISIYARTKQNSPCPYCTGKSIPYEQSIAHTHSDVITDEWDFASNKRSPKYFTSTSKDIVYWLDSDKEPYKMSIVGKLSPNDMPNGKSLQASHPHIAQWWHPTKNSYAPNTITYKNNDDVWWTCSEGHEYRRQIDDRVHQRDRCLVCVSIVTTHPPLALEYDTKKNQVPIWKQKSNSNNPAYWKCPEHGSYIASVTDRISSSKTLCPYCNKQ
jgi:hypothetical protein